MTLSDTENLTRLSEHVTYRTEGDVAIVTTLNPPAELFTEAMFHGITDAIDRAVTDGIRAMVIKSDAPLFSGGVDVSVFMGRTVESAKELLGGGMKMIAALEDAPFPIIAAVNGLCFAAGLELALACDFIYAADDAVFCQVEAFIGATTFLGGVYRLAERCGPAVAREIVYTADRYSAQQFADWNIANTVVPTADLHASAIDTAHRIARGPLLAHAATKMVMRHALDHGSRATDQVMVDDVTTLLPTHDMQTAVGQLLEHGAKWFRENRDQVVFEGR